MAWRGSWRRDSEGYSLTSSALPVTPDAAAHDPLAFQLLNELGIIDQLAHKRAAKLLGPALKLSQFVVLNYLTRLGGERSPARSRSAKARGCRRM